MKIKTAIWIGGILVALMLVPSSILFYQNQKLKTQVAEYAGQQSIDYKALTKSLQRAETSIAKNVDELNVFGEQQGVDMSRIQKDLRSMDARLVAVASSEAKTTTVVHNHYPSDESTPSEIEVETRRFQRNGGSRRFFFCRAKKTMEL
jgi:hypothetical protein